MARTSLTTFHVVSYAQMNQSHKATHHRLQVEVADAVGIVGSAEPDSMPP